jgi:hypothetical protein
VLTTLEDEIAIDNSPDFVKAIAQPAADHSQPI